MKWIKKFLCLCDHKWSILKTNYVYQHGTSMQSKDNSLPVHTDYILKCEKCGDIQKRRV